MTQTTLSKELGPKFIREQFLACLKSKKNTDKCSYLDCREESQVILRGKPLCDTHWQKYCNFLEN